MKKRGLLWMGLALGVVFTAAYLPLTQHGLTRVLRVGTHLEQVEAIVVLGGGLKDDARPGISTAERVAYGAHLYRLGLGQYLILSGGDHRSGSIEASVMRRMALEEKVDAGRIIVEPHARDTYENAVHVRQLLDSRRIETRLILVTSPYHMLRAKACFAEQGMVALPAPVPMSEVYDYGPRQNLRNMALLGHELLGLAYYSMLQRI